MWPLLIQSCAPKYFFSESLKTSKNAQNHEKKFYSFFTLVWKLLRYIFLFRIIWNAWSIFFKECSTCKISFLDEKVISDSEIPASTWPGSELELQHEKQNQNNAAKA